MTQEKFKDILEMIKEKLLSRETIEKIDVIKEKIDESTKIKEKIKDHIHKKLVTYEVDLLNKLYNLLKKYNIYISSKTKEIQVRYILEAEREQKLQIKHHYVGLVINEIPKFKGADGRIYGPYKPGDIILINKEDYNLLKERGYVKEVRLEK